MTEPGSWAAGEYPGPLFFENTPFPDLHLPEPPDIAAFFTSPPLDADAAWRLERERRAARLRDDSPDPTRGLSEDEERDIADGAR